MSDTVSSGKHERLGDLFDFQNGRGFKKSEWSSKGLPIIRIQNLNDPDAPFNYYNGAYSDDILVSAGDLLFSWSGTVGSSFGPHIWQRDQGVLNQHIFKVLPKREIDLPYAFYALQQITQDIEQEVSGSVGLVHITKKRLNEFTIPVPPLPEQRRIVAILDEAFEGIAAAKANAERAMRNADSLFESALEMTFDGEDGELAPLDSVCSIESTLVDPREKAYANVLHVGGANMETASDELIDLKTSQEEGLVSGKFAFTNDVVLYSKIRPYLRKVCRPGFSGLCSADIYPLTPKAEKIDRGYLFYLLLSPQFTRYAVEGSARAGMPKVNRPHLFAYRFVLPDLGSQRETGRKLDAIRASTRSAAEAVGRKLAALDELKASLLHQAFTGAL